MAPIFAIIRYALLETFFCIPILPKTIAGSKKEMNGRKNKKLLSKLINYLQISIGFILNFSGNQKQKK
ncbi:MAG: hypothetical protein GX285_04600 [Clostridiales bacterium]|nr:hypothetical protein [Clostridiales bacterium]